MSPQSPGYLKLENRHTGEVLELRRRRDQGVLVLELRGTLPPHREGPPLHVHRFEDEIGKITAGTLSGVVGGRPVRAGPGESVTLPRGVPHRWWNEGDELLAFEGQVRPLVDFDQYLQAVFEVMNAGPSGRPPLFYLAHLAVRHRHSQAVLVMPGPIQALVFRIALVIGTLLGRYRGNDWPGCPTRCTGAPMAEGADGQPHHEPVGSRPSLG